MGSGGCPRRLRILEDIISHIHATCDTVSDRQTGGIRIGPGSGYTSVEMDGIVVEVYACIGVAGSLQHDTIGTCRSTITIFPDI